MIRLYMTVEGQTEQAFASQILVKHLAGFHVFLAKPRLTGPSSRRSGRIPQGGMFNRITPSLEDIQRWLLEDKSPDARFTMMIDLYDLPSDCPGYREAEKLVDPYVRVEALEAALAEKIDDSRFIPYLQLHEFEALLLSAPEQFGMLFDDADDATAELVRACQQFKSPEHIKPRAPYTSKSPDFKPLFRLPSKRRWPIACTRNRPSGNARGLPTFRAMVIGVGKFAGRERGVMNRSLLPIFLQKPEQS